MIPAVMSADPRYQFEVVEEIRSRDEPFVTLVPGEPAPPGVGVVIISRGLEADLSVDTVTHEDPRSAVDMAFCRLRCGPGAHHFIFGIDPGKRPGLALLCDGRRLLRRRTFSPEAVRDEVERLQGWAEIKSLTIRIGHGDPTNRDRTIVAVWDMVDAVEVVDETGTTRGEHPDLNAAQTIAVRAGRQLGSMPEVEPTPGELREIQRRSRIASRGRLTITVSMARDVALGRMTLSDAVRLSADPGE